MWAFSRHTVTLQVGSTIYYLQDVLHGLTVLSAKAPEGHISEVKDPWQHSNHDEPIGQMILTNQRLDKLAFARACFIVCGMLLEHPQFPNL
ncbi:hypothetical protein EI94DRAFT_1591148 [Lactarius quietus]|nr:hypothetical protein EI94DRAFT_1591148 [Lactarius quietus]